MRPWLWLYRPPVLGARAQSVQILNTAAAVAATGRRVTVFCDPVGAVTPAQIRRHFGLSAVPSLRLRVLPRGGTAASVAFRAHVAAWSAAHPDGIVLARHKRYARELLRARPSAHVVLEAHEVDSLLLLERGEPSAAMHALEAEVLGAARGVVANAPGTLELLAAVHRLPPARVVTNGTSLAGPIPPNPAASGVGYVGSLHADKDLSTLVRGAVMAGVGLTLVGPGDPARLGPLPAGITAHPGVAPAEITSMFAGFRALAVPVSDGLFGRWLTSPLKLWDARASGLPVVAADLPALHHAAPGGFLPARPGDPASWGRALHRAVHDDGLRDWSRARAHVRSWAERAAELIDFAESLT